MESAAKLIPKVEEMLPKLDSILISLNNILGDKEHPCHPALDREDNRQPGSSQFAGKRADE